MVTANHTLSNLALVGNKIIIVWPIKLRIAAAF